MNPWVFVVFGLLWLGAFLLTIALCWASSRGDDRERESLEVRQERAVRSALGPDRTLITVPSRSRR